MNALRCNDLRKGYPGQQVLRGLNLDADAGTTVAIRGASGTGKSTLLHCLGLLDTPDHGSIEIKGQRGDNLGPAARARMRARHLGFVFQAFHLLPDFSVLENIVMAARAAELPLGPAIAEANRLLARLGLVGKADRNVTTLSGGERSRVALCRAVINRPAVILADEPTGSLDPATAALVLQELLALARDHQAAVVMVTHDPAIAAQCDREYQLVDGILV